LIKGRWLPVNIDLRCSQEILFMNDRGITTVKIFGKDYPIASDQNPEYIEKLAEFVDCKMNEIAEGGDSLSTSRVAVLACLNIADELMRTKSEKDRFIRLIEGRIAKAAKMVEDKISSLQEGVA
jgi:cell division protein ZapA